MEILHMAGQNLANVPYLLSAGQREAGRDSRYWTIYNDSYIKYPEDIITPYPRDNVNIANVFYEHEMDKADVYHIHSPYKVPAPVLKHVGKKELYMHYHGTFLRRTGGIRSLNRQAKYIFVSTPDLLFFLNKEYRKKAFYVPNPVTIVPRYCCAEDTIVEPMYRTEKFTISHATTVSERKGTYEVLDVMRYLKRRFNVDVHLCIKKNHWQSLQTMGMCDLYLDQFIRGLYGVGAVEALLMGKMVIGYIMNKWRRFFPGLPIKSADTFGLLDAIKVVMYEWESKYGPESEQRMKWANTFHNPDRIAEYYLNIYDGKVEPTRDPTYFLRWKD